MKLVKRGPNWWVDFRSPDGKRHRVSTGEKDEAAAYERAGRIVQTAMVAPSTPTTDNRLALSAALDSTWQLHWQRMRSGVIMRRVVSMLCREFAGVKVADVSTKLLRAHCERWLASGTAPATVNRRMAAVGVALTRCAEDGDIVARPKMPHFAENNTKERYMTTDEEVKVLMELDRQGSIAALQTGSNATGWHYMRHLSIFLMDTGFRFSEAFKFTLVDGHASLNGMDTKTGKGRRVPLTTRALASAEYMLAAAQHAALLAMTGKQPWDWCSHRWGVVTKAAGCPDVTLHILRHTCASRLVQKGVPIFTVSKWLGHSSVKVTERYAKLAPDSLAMALSALEGKPASAVALYGTQQQPQRSDSTDLGTLRLVK